MTTQNQNIWWQLPGPAGYIKQIVEAIRDGYNVVLNLPEHLCEETGLSNAIRAAVQQAQKKSWHPLDIGATNGLDPVSFLLKRFGSQNKTLSPRVSELGNEERFHRYIIWLEGLTPALWSKWRKFLSDYADINFDLEDRTVFCVPLIGILANQPPIGGKYLHQHRWNNIISRFDMIQFATQAFGKMKMSDLHKKLAITVVVNLALWDPEVCERLVSDDIKKVIEPESVESILRQIAQNRGWCLHNGDSNSDVWHLGMKNSIDEKDKEHSAALVLNDSTEEIQRRISSASVEVLLPYVEETRREILKNDGWRFQLPHLIHYKKMDKIINNINELEIGHMWWQISQKIISVNPDLEQHIDRLRKIRNTVAHFKPLDPELLNGY